MSQSDQSELWRSVLNGNLEAYLRVSSKLKLGLGGDDISIKLNTSSLKSRQSATDADGSGPVKAGRIPVRLYVRSANEDFDDVEDAPLVDNWDKVSYINHPVEIHDNGKCFTLFDAVKALLPELFRDKSVPNDSMSLPQVDDGERSALEEASSTGSARSSEETGESAHERHESCFLSETADIKLIRIQGIEPKLEIPFAWVINNLMNPEHFLHISVYVRVL